MNNSDLLAVPSRKVFLNEKYSGGAAPEIRVRSHLVAEDNRRVGTGEHIEVVNTVYGRMIVSMADPYTGSWLKNLGVYEEDDCIDTVRGLLAERPRGTILDIGANLGCWSLGLAHVADKVIAIEPQRAIYNALCGSIVLNGLTRRVFPKHCALGRIRGKAPILTVDPESTNNFGGTSLVGQVTEDTDPRFYEMVDVYPVQDIVAGDEHISFIKLDVEGYESEVLLGGMLEIMAVCRPIMFVEWALSNELALGQQIRAMGYILDYIGGNWLCLPLP